MKYENITPEKWFEQEQLDRKNKAEENFNFEKDIQDYIDTTFPKNEGGLAEQTHDTYVNGIKNQDTEITRDLANNIARRINYLEEKSRGDEEKIQYVLKLELLKQALEKI
ncbi:MAG: hypothetical protein Q8Q23_00505 [bacterium]|nr:hypothetical protein [bacterium]